MNKNIKINQYKLELLTERLLEFTVGLAMILSQSHNVEYRLSLDFISEFI